MMDTDVLKEADPWGCHTTVADHLAAPGVQAGAPASGVSTSTSTPTSAGVSSSTR